MVSEDKARANTEYAVGSFDALSVLLAVIARRLDLELEDDLLDLQGRTEILHPELEKHRINGYADTIGVFQSAYSRGPDIRS